MTEKNSIPYKNLPDFEQHLKNKRMNNLENMHVKIDKTQKEPERKFITKLWGGVKKSMLKSLLPELKNQIQWDFYFEKEKDSNIISAGFWIEIMGERIIDVEKTKSI